jgi:replicative DNA helicase Mcm
VARADSQELVDRFEQFYRSYYREETGELAQNYPSEQRSLYVDWQDLFTFDQDLADDYLSQPEQLQDYAEEALRLYDLPVDVSLGQAHVRVHNLPESTEIREIRSRHVNTLVSVQGIVRKATSVRPKIQEAAFECQRCGTLTRVPQSGGDFQEPHECQGCERQGPFTINFDQSEFVDSQQLRIQESPEGLRGGQTPENIDVHIEDDLTGEVSPGDHVTATGVLHLEQEGSGNEKSPVFDVYMDGVSVQLDDEEFEEMDIDEADKREIIERSGQDDIYDRMVESMAPSIYGYEQEKLAIILQLFSGVTKHLPDGSRTRGDLHVLLIGDPGTGKCLKGDTRVTLSDGVERPIRDLVEENLDDPKPVDDGVYDEVNFEVPSLGNGGEMTHQRATKVWKRDVPDRMYRIETASGYEVEVTPSHPLFVPSNGHLDPVKAETLEEGEFIAIPGHLPTRSEDTLDIEHRESRAPNAVRMNLPETWTPSLARLVGYVIGEGDAVLNDDHTGDVRVTNNDQEILDDVKQALDQLGMNYTESQARETESAREVRCNSGAFASFLAELEPAILERSAHQRVPDALMSASDVIKTQFLGAYVDCEGHVAANEREITVASMSRELLANVRSLLLSLGIASQLQERHHGRYRLRISGEDFGRYVETVGFVTDRKSVAAEAYGDVEGATNTNVIPELADDLRRIRTTPGLSQFERDVPRTTYQQYERGDRNPSREHSGDWNDVESAREEPNVSQQSLADGIDVTQTAVSYYERNGAIPDGGTVADATRVVRNQLNDARSDEPDVQALRNLADTDVLWDRIERIEPVDPDYEWVYDLEVEGTHSYVSNNVISHNSQLLQYVRNIAPRSVYTSGKGSSAAGLTAAAVRDDFGEGQQWSLEAGALVLADRGVAAIDELDKMDSGDRSAMHEGLEQQEISISKAGINATLKSRCSLLGAANPKYGRFDEYEPIAEQIDLEPALISRFDLIFTVTDKPDAEEDERLAEHILQTNYAGELNTQRNQLEATTVSQEQVERATEDVSPTLGAEFLRKYVAFAKRSCFPTMTEEAKARIRDFYTDLRAKGEGEDSPVPVTARKLEALVRLAEASARLRLSDEVELEDAERVIDVVYGSLQDIGIDPETGQYDADVVETGTSKSQRDRIKNIKGLVEEIEDDYEDGAPVDEVIERAEEIGMEPSKAEHEIEKLKQQGELYEPSQGHLRTT